MKKYTVVMAACLITLYGSLSIAETLVEVEFPSSNLKVSKDGTGIVKFKNCEECEFTLVKVTSKTKAFLNGVEMNLSIAKNRSKPGFIGMQYSPSSKEARSIVFAK